MSSYPNLFRIIEKIFFLLTMSLTLPFFENVAVVSNDFKVMLMQRIFGAATETRKHVCRYCAYIFLVNKNITCRSTILSDFSNLI